MNSGQTKQTLFQVLSLDVVLGSLSAGIFAITLLRVRPADWWWIILPLAVWVVYSLDHLLDGYKKKSDSVLFRHRFHYEKRKEIGFFVGGLGICAIVLSLLFLDQKIITAGIILLLAVVVYLLIINLLEKLNYRYFQKEFFIAIIYISGIFLAPFFWHNGPLSIISIIIVVNLFLIAWMESIIIAYYDYEYDKADGLKSFVVAFGQTRARQFIVFMLVLSAICSIILILISNDRLYTFALFIELIMSLALLVLILFPAQFGDKNRFRWLGEAVFYIPAVIGLSPVFQIV